LIRSVLEHAGYGLLIHRDPALGETWLRRQEGVAERKACRKAFTPGAIETALEALDKKLLAIWDELYEFSIDHGGHPNERSLTTNLSMDDVGKTKELQVQYLHGDSIFVQGAIRTLARAGLYAFQHTMAERFQLLGLRDELKELRKGL
jgi:hypothetical protein